MGKNKGGKSKGKPNNVQQQQQRKPEPEVEEPKIYEVFDDERTHSLMMVQIN